MKPYTLDNNHRIDADPLQWILQERSTSGKGRYTWRNIGFYTHLKELMDSYRERFERTSLGTLPKGLVESKHAADRAWEAVSRMIERNPEVETLREQIGSLEESLLALKRRENEQTGVVTGNTGCPAGCRGLVSLWGRTTWTG